MNNRVIGPGVSLPPAQNLYPASLTNIPYTMGSNMVALAPGDSVQIPAGDWFIDLGKYSILEFQDPELSGTISQSAGVWRPIRTQRGSFPIRSDGVNFRISNLTGCAVTASVVTPGQGYVQASTTITPSAGNSTWVPVTGARLQNISLTGLGAGYGVAPIVFIAQPPAPGVPATAHATIVAGALTAITVDTAGAGYTSAPTVTILPNPFDPNIGSITAATAQALTTGSGAINAALCTNPGIPVASTMTLAVSGVGTSAQLSPNFLTTISAITLSAVGSGSITGAAITTYGGIPAVTSGVTLTTEFIPRQAQIALTVTSGAAVTNSGTIIDGGMFLGTVSPIVMTYGGSYASAAAANAITVTLTQGSATDQVIIQPL